MDYRLTVGGALALQNKTETAVFIEAFTGSHRFILDYLVDEVLAQQPDEVRQFLLQTAILNKFNPALCTAVTEKANSKAILKALERENLFLIPLDDERHWYRYHHLFADVLQTYLLEEQSDHVAELHSRASIWFEQNDFKTDAIQHALDAQDFARAADLIELVWPEMENRKSVEWLSLAKQLPDDLLQMRPVLSHNFGWALLDAGEFEPSEARFVDVEKWINQIAHDDQQDVLFPPEMIIVDQEQFKLLPGSIATARAYRSLGYGDVANAVQFAQQALDLLPETALPQRGAAASLLGLAQYASGDLLGADRSLTEFRNNAQERGVIPDVLSITFILADIKLILGRLQETMRFYKNTIELANAHNQPIGTADLYRGISELYIEQNDLETAQQHLSAAQKLSEQFTLPDWEHRFLRSMARLKSGRREFGGGPF